MDSESISRNLPILLFIFIFFGFQIFYQIWNYSFQIPSNKNNMQNFVFALVLIGLVIYYGNPQLSANFYSSIALILTFILLFIYCYSKKGLDDMTEKDKKLGLDVRSKGLTLIIVAFYGVIALIYLGIYLSRTESLLKAGEIVGVGILIIFLVIFFHKFNTNPDDHNNLPLGLYIFPQS